MAHNDRAEFIHVLESQIKALERERDKLKPLVDRYTLMEGQLDLLRRTRNAFAQERVINPAVEMNDTKRSGKLGVAVLELLNEIGRPIHVDEFLPRLKTKGFESTRQSVVGILSRAYQLKQIDRPAPQTYGPSNREEPKEQRKTA